MQAIDVGSMGRTVTLPDGTEGNLRFVLDDCRNHRPNAHLFFAHNVDVYMNDEKHFTILPSIDCPGHDFDELVELMLVNRAAKMRRDADYTVIECYSEPLVRYDPPRLMRVEYELYETGSTRSTGVLWGDGKPGSFEAWGFKFTFDPKEKKLSIWVPDQINSEPAMYQEAPIVIYYDQLVNRDTPYTLAKKQRA